MNNKIIGRFIPVNNFNRGYAPFNVITKEQSSYLPPSWEGIREDGEKYHVAEFAWRFEPMKWDGEGLPPVGCECQYSLNGGVTWFDCRIEYLVGSQGVVMSCDVFEGIQYASTSQYDLKFRPIPSEADKKRDESIKALKFSFGAFDVNGLADMVYHAIAAGKIPHIRID